MSALNGLPANLPVPSDDGAAAHLPGWVLPDLALPATDGSYVAPARLHGRTVLYCYPMTGRPDVPLPDGWDSIPGARGCTPEACGFRDHYADLQRHGAGVYGISTQPTAWQQEARTRLHLPFALLSDADLHFTRALRLPTFAVAGMTLLRRLTLIVRDGQVEHLWYPVFPPDTHAAQVVAWLVAHPV